MARITKSGVCTRCKTFILYGPRYSVPRDARRVFFPSMETLHGQGFAAESSEPAASSGGRPRVILSSYVRADQPVRDAIPPSPVLLLMPIRHTKLCPQIVENLRYRNQFRSGHGSQYS